ncbi:MAG: aminoacyl--tRNA ligase-related protein [Pseudonocardiaceae bacterium]
MIDITLLRTDPDLLRRTAEQRGADVDVDRLVDVEAELRQESAQATSLRTQRRRQAMSREQVDADAAQALKDEVSAVNEKVRALQELRDELWAQLPNLLAADTPGGDNVELRREGHPVVADEARGHVAVGAALGILDPARGAQVAGSGGYYWRGDGARLAWAVFTHAQSVLQARGLTPVMPPVLAGDGVVGYYGDQIIDTAELPIRVAAIGAQAVEQVVLCRPQDAEYWLGQCQRNAEDILRDLELPYRVVRVRAGDLPAPAYQAFATECWFPGSGDHQQTHSAANLTDYQARGLRIRYLDAGRVAQPYTLSATGVTDRAVLAILENHVQPDGSVRIPEAVRPYLGGQELIEPKVARTG